MAVPRLPRSPDLTRSSSRRPRITRAEIAGAFLFSLMLLWLGLMAVSLAH